MNSRTHRPAVRSFLWHSLLAVSGLLGTGVLSAQERIVTTTYSPTMAEAGVGSQHRDTVNQAVGLALEGKTDRAAEMVEPVVAYCDQQLERNNIRFVSAGTAEEYGQHLGANVDGEPTEWLDIACASAYNLVGFVHAADRRLEDALLVLEKAIAIAPFYPNPINEKGFVLNQLGRFDEGIAAYRQVIALAERHPPAAYAKGVALRGIGWALIETGDLDGAQRMYEESLIADPDNQTARNELQYIARKRAASGPSSAPDQ